MRLLRTVRFASVAAGLLLLSATIMADETCMQLSSIKFDGKQGNNPSSPAGGKIIATGSYTLAQDDLFYSIEMKYRIPPPPGDGGWTAVTANVDQMNKSWDKTVTGLPAGTYEVHAVLRVVRNSTKIDIATETRTVTIAGP